MNDVNDRIRLNLDCVTIGQIRLRLESVVSESLKELEAATMRRDLLAVRRSQSKISESMEELVTIDRLAADSV